MQCMVYARQRWGEITKKTYASPGGNYTAQDLYDNWTGSKGKSMQSSLPALALWKRNGGAGHTGIVEKKDGSNYFYSDHNGLDGGNDGYGDRTTDDVPGLFTNFIGYCY